MTDRLTPGQLRDLSDLCAVGNRVVTLTANGETTRFYPNKDLAYVLREEAARRGAEAADGSDGEHAVSVGYTEDDVRRLAEWAVVAGAEKHASTFLTPFRALLDGGPDAKA